MTSHVSVVIPSYDRAEYLRRVLPSYLSQPAVRQVVIVDDGSPTDYGPVMSEATQLARDQGVELVYCRHEDRKGAPAARNSALEHVTGDVVLFSDDDVLLAPDFVEQGLKRLGLPDVDIAGGRMILSSELSTLDVSHRASRRPRGAPVFDYVALTADYTVDSGADVELPFVHTVSLWKRWVLDAGVRFDTGYLGNGYREESAAQVEARLKGARIYHCPQMVFWHVRSRRAGGQYRGSTMWWYLWSLHNNRRFLRRYYRFLRETFGLRTPAWLSFLALALRLTSGFVPATIKAPLAARVRW